MSLYSYKYRLKPTKEQEILLSKHFGCVRFLFNYFLDNNINLYKNEKKSLSYYDNQNTIPELKKIRKWLKEVNSQSLQYAARMLDNAFKNFFRRIKQGVKGKKGFPKFKAKHAKQSFKVMQKLKLTDNKLIIPKFREGIEIILDRPLIGEIQFATVSKNKAGQYFVSITVNKVIEKLPTIDKSVGLDLNIDTIVDQNGSKYFNPLPRTKHRKRLRLLNKAVSRAKVGSKGRQKALLKRNKLEQHIHNIREDFQHKVTTKIINENQVIVLETLSAKDMLKNEYPDERKIPLWMEKAFNRKVADASFSFFVQKIKYKCEWYGRQLVFVDKWYPSSQLCSTCNYQNKSLTLEDRDWTCLNCWTYHDRDINAAINIHNEGINPSWNRGRAVCPSVRPVIDGLLAGTEAENFVKNLK